MALIDAGTAYLDTVYDFDRDDLVTDGYTFDDASALLEAIDRIHGVEVWPQPDAPGWIRIVDRRRPCITTVTAVPHPLPDAPMPYRDMLDRDLWLQEIRLDVLGAIPPGLLRGFPFT